MRAKLDAAISDARKFSGDSGFAAVLLVVGLRLEAARTELESASLDRVPEIQGRIRALRGLVFDMTGVKS